jgi:hypothetical protein
MGPNAAASHNLLTHGGFRQKLWVAGAGNGDGVATQMGFGDN